MDNRVELCCHTKMSKLQGINDAKDYIGEAIKRGYKFVAITDTDSTQSFFEIEKYLKQNEYNNKIKVIYGAEMHFKVSEEFDKVYTIYIYVKEQTGLKNLYKLISKAYRNIKNGMPIIYKNDLLENREGLLYAAIGNQSEVYQNIENSNVNKILAFYDFIGIEPNESNKNINIKINELCIENNKLLIGTSECNFINKEDYKCNEVLNFYKKSTNIECGNNKYFQTTDELLNSFDYIEASKEIVINNPTKIAEQVEKIDLIPQKLDYPIINFADRIIIKKCYDKAQEIYGEQLSKDIKDRLELELQSIRNNKFDSIYLISSELVKYSNKFGYKVGSRGSVGNSFVAYLLGITNINPIEYNLPFELFAGKDYDKEPDIDLNFSGKIQSKIFEYLQQKFGKERIIWGGTVGSLTEITMGNCYDEYAKSNDIKDISDKDEIGYKLLGIKTCTREHPGGVFILPENMEITDIYSTEIGENGYVKTHNDYHSIWDSGLYMFHILGHDFPTIIHELEKETNTNSNDIKIDDKETLKMLSHANDKSYPISINGIPEFSTTFVKKMIEISKPCNFNDLVCISALSHGTGTWLYNAESLIAEKHIRIDEVISNRGDMYNYLVNHGIEKNLACDIVEFVRNGKASFGRALWKHHRDRFKQFNDRWDEFKKILQEHNIPEWYIEDAEKIDYMFPKSHAIGYTMYAFKMAWYKVHYPEAFYKAYFKIKSDLKLKDYYCKRQVRTELNRLYDLKEIQEYNKKNDYDYCIKDKITDLELILEMFNRGVLKEKAEIKDDYNLINSRAISDYCRSIKHKFNTEELAVLVYRNLNMSIDEKIAKYNDLIKNYPDMEVIRRSHCNHYDSVKTLIKNEIRRIKTLKNKLIKEEENCIYTWTEFNKSTLQYEHYNDIDNTFRTYKEAIKDIQNYIKENDDTISFNITKKYFGKRKSKISAYYNVENQKFKLINLWRDTEGFINIDQIFLNIPTPFKKGDILISNSTTGNKDIFVLNYLCTWRKNLNSLLADGNYDSSDMIGYGYYFRAGDSTTIINDDKWNYDSFEYYEGELIGKNRILKDISSFMKEKIDIELFIRAYDYFKDEYRTEFPCYFTDEGLKLAGLSETDIQNHRDND